MDRFPLHEVGELELNRNPENYFAEVEQAAFEPRNIVPGMGFSPDKMFAGTPDFLSRCTPLPAGRQLRFSAGEQTAVPVPHL